MNILSKNALYVIILYVLTVGQGFASSCPILQLVTNKTVRNQSMKQKNKHVCLKCNKEFYVYAWQKRKYCSLECSRKRIRTKEERLNSSIAHKKTCLRGKNHPNYRGRYITKKGYAYISKYEIPDYEQYKDMFSDMYGTCILEHRLIMARSLKRPLLRNENVHHINGDCNDNRLENLEIYSASGHQRYHRNTEKNIKRLMVENRDLKELLRKNNISW